MNTEKDRRNLNLAYCESIVREVEERPTRLPAFYVELEAALRWLTDATRKSENPAEKMRLAATKTRVRLVLERFRKASVN